MHEAESSLSPGRISPSCGWWLLAGMAFLIIIGALCIVVLLPAGVRALPGRYAARLPDFLQDMRHRPHSDTLPTPALVFSPLELLLLTPTPQRLDGLTVITATPLGESLTPPFMATVQPSGRPTLQSSGTPTVMPTPTATFAPTSTPLPLQASLSSITHTYQTWNNCGPATLSMALRYFDRTETQADAAAFLKPDPEDKNVSPHELAVYAHSLGLEATVRVGGNLTRLKGLIAAGFPVIVETWFIPEPGDQMGHYRLLTGYDDAAGHLLSLDSYNGPGVQVNYNELDELWRVFDRLYLVVYDSSQANQLAILLGEDVDDRVMYARALETAQAEALNPSVECVAYQDCADGGAFAWFNVGSNLTALGRHEEAAAAYDQARLLGLPWRMLWYQFGPYESYYRVGRYDDVVILATVTLSVVENLEESYYWRGMAYLAREETDKARDDFKAAVKYNPNFTPAVAALEGLE